MTSGLGSLVQAQWNDPVEAVEQCYALGWTDGLPVVPPTVQRVEEFLAVGQRPADEVIGGLPERRREVTVGKVAANAVMAGCKPEYFPVVLATAEAMLDPAFNLIGPSSSLGGAAILVILNGPVVPALGINSRNNLFGPGNRANSTIGRAVRLILMNTCAAVPGLFDRTILGHPGKFSYCIAENEAGTSWTPLHVERGFDQEDSAVTVFACEGPRQVRASNRPETMLYSAADVISSLGTSMASAGSVGDTSTCRTSGRSGRGLRRHQRRLGGLDEGRHSALPAPKTKTVVGRPEARRYAGRKYNCRRRAGISGAYSRAGGYNGRIRRRRGVLPHGSYSKLGAQGLLGIGDPPGAVALRLMLEGTGESIQEHIRRRLLPVVSPIDI